MWVPEKLNSGADGPWSAGWPALHSSPRRQVAGIGGNRSAFIVYLDEGLAIVVLTNLVGGNPERFIPQIADLYIKPSQGQLAQLGPRAWEPLPATPEPMLSALGSSQNSRQKSCPSRTAGDGRYRVFPLAAAS